MSEVLDSYTGEPYIESYISPIPNIQRGRESFWRRAERLKAAEQYWVSPHFDPEEGGVVGSGPAAPLVAPLDDLSCDPRSSRERRPSGWLLRRKDSPADLIPLLPSQESAVRVMDWCVRNDASVRIVLYWLLKGNVAPYMAFMQDIVKVATND